MGCISVAAGVVCACVCVRVCVRVTSDLCHKFLSVGVLLKNVRLEALCVQMHTLLLSDTATVCVCACVCICVHVRTSGECGAVLLVVQDFGVLPR